MKIDIGSDGKIVGTKRVSPNGQVSGLSEYAGEEVLVIYPGPSGPRVRMDAKDYAREMEHAVQQQMSAAFRHYQGLKDRYRDEREATRRFIRDKSPKGFQGLFEQVDDWVSSQLEAAEDRVAKRLGDEGSGDAPTGGSDGPAQD